MLREGPEQQSTAYVTSSVLHRRQLESLRLGPVVRDVTEVLGIGGPQLTLYTQQLSVQNRTESKFARRACV
jgi:hypothetical protein